MRCEIFEVYFWGQNLGGKFGVGGKFWGGNFWVGGNLGVGGNFGVGGILFYVMRSKKR